MSQPQAIRPTRGRSSAIANIVPPPNQLAFTAEQQEQLFQLQVAKAVAENAAIVQATASAALFAEQQRTFAAERHAADMAQQAATAAAAAVAPQQAPAQVVDVSDGELPPEALAVTKHYARFPQKQLALIWNGKFDPFNLYKLYGDPLVSGDDDIDVFLSFSEGRLLSKKPAGKLKDYGSDSRIWSASFLNYISIMTSFFSSMHPGLHRVLMDFF